MKTPRELAKEIEGLIDLKDNDMYYGWDFDITKAEALIVADRAEMRRAVVKDILDSSWPITDSYFGACRTIKKSVLDAIAEGGK